MNSTDKENTDKIGKIHIIVKILFEAYSVEQTNRNAIIGALLKITDEDIWNLLFQVHIGNIIYKDMLLEAIEKLGYRYEGMDVELFKFIEKSEKELLKTIYDWERFSFKYCKSLLEIIDFDALQKLRVNTDALKKILEEMLKLKEKHIEMIQKACELVEK